MSIPIRNLYYMFCYAWQKMPDTSEIAVGAEDAPDLLNLFAKLTASGINGIIRRGLDRGYVGFVEETRAPRGKMLMDAVLKEQTLRRGSVVCSFDELTPDILHNQVLKATARKLSRSYGVDPALAHELIVIQKRLSHVSDIRVTASTFGRIQLCRNTRQYVPLLRLCEFVHRRLLPVPGGDGFMFSGFLEDEVAMSNLFEEFLREFYRHEQNEYKVSSEQMQWHGVATDPGGWSVMPLMVTDITLRSPSSAIVMDAKYYKEPMVSAFGSPKLRAAHLYQLSAYMQRTAAGQSPPSVSGALIYGVKDSPFSLGYVLNGHTVRAEGVDLSLPWPNVRSRLLGILETLGD